jgi:hypothetical protein
MQGELFVATIAAVDYRDDLRLGRIRDRDRVAVCIERYVEVRIDAHDLSGRIRVAQLDRDAVRESRLEDHAKGTGRISDVGAKGVRVVAAGVVDQLIGLRGWFRIGSRLQRLGQDGGTARPGAHGIGTGCPLNAGNVTFPARGIAIRRRYEFCDRKAHVGELEPLLDRAIGEDGEVDHRRASDDDGRHAVSLQHRERRRRVGRRVICRVGRRCGDRLAQVAGRRRWSNRPASAVAAASGEPGQYEGHRPQPCDRMLHGRLRHFLGSAFLGAAFFMSLTTTWSRTAR